jgi:hypothetical protein
MTKTKVSFRRKDGSLVTFKGKKKSRARSSAELKKRLSKVPPALRKNAMAVRNGAKIPKKGRKFRSRRSS